jgi:hypothetical protein
METKLGICDVCRLLDKDTSQKSVFYCEICDSWICEEDKNNWIRRITAAAKRELEPNYKGTF